MATRKGLEPSTSGVTGRRSNQLNYRAILILKQTSLQLTWQGQKESNPRHAVLETAALPAELYPYFTNSLQREGRKIEMVRLMRFERTTFRVGV